MLKYIENWFLFLQDVPVTRTARGPFFVAGFSRRVQHPKGVLQLLFALGRVVVSLTPLPCLFSILQAMK